MPFSELAAQYEAFPPLNPPRWRNLHGAMEEAQRHNNRQMQQTRNNQRNEQEAQLQLQQNVAGYQAQGNNNDDDDIYADDIYVNEPVGDLAPAPPVSFFAIELI